MKTAKLSFFPRKDRMDKSTLECPLNAWLTVNGKRVKISINRKITIEKWRLTNRLQKARKPDITK